MNNIYINIQHILLILIFSHKFSLDKSMHYYKNPLPPSASHNNFSDRWNVPNKTKDHVCYSFSQKRHLFWTNSLTNVWPFSFPLSPWTNYSKRLRWCNILVNKTKKLIFKKHYIANCSTLNRCILYSECTKELLKIKSKFWTLCCLTLERISKETDIKCIDNK